MKIYNTLTRHKDDFVPIEPGQVRMYVCGPTPYNVIHIGNARTFLIFDVIRRYLEFAGYQVRMVQNITDVDDKVINAARDSGGDWRALSLRFTDAYLRDMAALGIRPPDVAPRATDYIDAMIEIIRLLVEKGFAYVVDGSVYFEVRRWPDYGKLSRRNLDDLLAGARVEAEEGLRDPLDFALWKAAKPGEPSWDSPFGPGRPGWHIECSAMSMRLLDGQLDIHGGGADLIFPHHENEIAQSEAATGKVPFVRYWMHAGRLTVNAQKMSKSLGNFATVQDVLSHYRPQVVRLLFLSTHYRSELDFTDAAMEQAKAGLERLEAALGEWDRLLAMPDAEGDEALAGLDDQAAATEQAFREAMDDDFNTARAMAALFDLVSEANRLTSGSRHSERSEESASQQPPPGFRPTPAAKAAIGRARETLLRLTGVLGLELAPQQLGDELSPRLIEVLIAVRQMARERRQYDIADAVRLRLRELGISLEDHPEGTTWRRV
jgi:cysteinyl-tRNA synthetase